MLENFKSLEDIFRDEDFEELVKGITPPKVENTDPEIEKFKEIISFVEKHGREPKQTSTLMERRLYSRLRGIRNKPDNLSKYKAYDYVNLLGD